jgi:2-oxoacid:acceptor oxidoreductase gamma subunit (pyruvate/2-ketoisovalerate family)
MKEIRIHSRGGQGGVTAARILASAFVKEGRFAAAFPMFATERRGAPVTSFLRVDETPIRQRTLIYEPDCLLVLAPDLIYKNIFGGLKPKGVLVVNTTDFPGELQSQGFEIVGFMDASRVGIEEIGTPITNTSMMGAFARTTKWIGLDSVLSSLSEYFTGSILEKNRRCVKRGFYEAEVILCQTRV